MQNKLLREQMDFSTLSILKSLSDSIWNISFTPASSNTRWAQMENSALQAASAEAYWNTDQQFCDVQIKKFFSTPNYETILWCRQIYWKNKWKIRVISKGMLRKYSDCEILIDSRECKGFKMGPLYGGRGRTGFNNSVYIFLPIKVTFWSLR